MGADAANPASPSGGKRPAREWTDAQRAAIHTIDRSVLVSAAAGSGKTAVLSERCAHLVCDATPPCDVDQILVVTYTEAAAAEMKSRIRQALQARLEATESPHVQRQLALMDRAQVGTLHGFCASLLRQHFQHVGLDPDFSILSGEEAELLRCETARELLFDRFETDPDDGPFQSLVDAYGDGADDRLADVIVRTHELLGSVLDPEAWLAEARLRIIEAASGDLEQSALGRELRADLAIRLAALSSRCDASIAALRRQDGFAKYIAFLEEHAQVLRHWAKVLRDEGLAALCEESTFEAGRLPTISSDVPGKALALARVNAVRDEMKSGELARLLRFSPTQWQEGLRAIAPHAELLLELVREFGARYEAAKAKVHALDFADLERHALRALRIKPTPSALQPSPVARMYHRRFRHVMVDEYQDINEVQDALLSLLSRECLCQGQGHDGNERGNLFCVGDVKQSVYRFRLAEPQRFLNRDRAFREKLGAVRGVSIDLQANFRSRAPLLRAINAAFARLMTREGAEIDYDATHHLRPGLDYPPADDGGFHGALVELHLLPATVRSNDETENDDAEADDLNRTEREAAFIAGRVRALLGMNGQPAQRVAARDAAGQWTTRPLRPRDVVVLLRSRKFKAGQYADALRAAGVPVYAEEGSGFLEAIEVRDVLSLLSLLDNQRQDLAMAAVLRSPIANLPKPEDALARIRLAYGGEGDVASRESPVAFHEAVTRYAAEKHDELSAALRDLLDQLVRWRTLAQRRPLAEVLWTVYEESGYLAFVAGLLNGEQRVANLLDLYHRARQFGSFHKQGLARFLSFLEQLREETDLGRPAVASESEDVVRVMTVHKSKGMEFPVVVAPDLGKQFNLNDIAGAILVDRQAKLGMMAPDPAKRIRYPSLAHVLVRSRLRFQSLSEELRILYVAMTRAKEHLILVGTCGADAAAKWEDRWAGHEGPMPPDEAQAARTPLDWLGPVAAMTRAAGAFDVTLHSFNDDSGEHRPQRQIQPQIPRSLVDLLPLDPPPAPSPAADAVIDQITRPYRFAAVTSLPAAVAATEIAKETTPISGDTIELPLPRVARAVVQPAATEIGTATHTFLRHLDYDRALDRASLVAQLDAIAARRLMAAELVPLIDLDAIEWFLETELGQRLRGARAVHRELTVYGSIAPELPEHLRPDLEPHDNMMLRGRIDLLFETKASLELVDFKTDDVDGDRLTVRAAGYRKQLCLYRKALEHATGKSVCASHLVFLRARKIVSE